MILNGFLFTIGVVLALLVICGIIACLPEEKPEHRPLTMAEMLRNRRLGDR